MGFKKVCAFLFSMFMVSSTGLCAVVTDVDRELLKAASRGDINFASFALSKGANPNVTDKLGNTPLNLAADGGFENIVELLITHKAAIDKYNLYGYTPLLSAITNGHRYLAGLLIKAGANAKTQNRYGTSPEDYIEAQGFFTINEYISGAEPAISTIVDDRESRRGELGAFHNEIWQERFNRLISENKISEATDFLVQLTSEDNFEASFLLGALHMERNNPGQGLVWLRNALNSQNPEVLYHAGRLLLEAGNTKDILNAEKAIKEAALQGNNLAKTDYAKLLLEKSEDTLNIQEAYSLFTEAANANTPEAFFYLGYMEIVGKGTEINEKNGFELIKLASDMGHIGAKTFLRKQEADDMIKQISALEGENFQNMKTFLVSLNAVPIEKNEECQIYDFSDTPVFAYKILSGSFCPTGNANWLTLQLSPTADLDEIQYLQTFAKNINFTLETK